MDQRLVRIGDEEREQTVALLHEHASRGRLDPEELDDRVERALRARTRDDLAALTADLPDAAAAPARRSSRPVQRFRRSVGIWAVMSVFFIAIWVAGGGGSFWPVWPILGWALALGIQGVKLLTGGDERDEDDRDALPRGA